jgi:pimeloyl-ACP methyl ester carboxylesterase
MGVHFESLATAPPVPLFHDITLRNGVRLRYAEQGMADGPVVMMIHGYTDSSFSYSRVLPLLPSWVRAIVPDLRGHGGSDRPGNYRMEHFATDVFQLMDALEIDHAAIVGHSMGSFVARKMGVMAPARVTQLVLAGAAPSARNETVNELRRAVDGLRDPIGHEFVRDFQVSTVYRDIPPGFMAYVIAESERVPASVWKGALAGMMDDNTAPREIRVPTLIVGGDRDGIFSRAEQEALARQIPGGRSRIYRGVGHAPHWEDPETFAGELVAVVAEGAGV